MGRFTIIAGFAVSLSLVQAHLAPYAQGMYCLNGPQDAEDLNSQAIVTPMYMMTKSDWWMHAYNGCNKYPPKDGSFLELPAGGSFSVDIVGNRADASSAIGGKYATEWTDGSIHPASFAAGDGNCISTPNIHTPSENAAAGTVFAISYESDINNVTPENLVVFTVKKHTPFRRVTTYQVPANMPACPPGGCHCVWGWVPNGCGIPNMYMTPWKCTVTGATATAPVLAAKPPVWCQNNSATCVSGPKQMIFWNQLDGNNVKVDGYDASGAPKSPGYNENMGFYDGAQNDIFGASPAAPKTTASPSPSPTLQAKKAAVAAVTPVPTSSEVTSSSSSSIAPATTSSAVSSSAVTSVASSTSSAASSSAASAVPTARTCSRQRRRDFKMRRALAAHKRSHASQNF